MCVRLETAMNRFSRFLGIFLLLDVLSGLYGKGARDKLVNWISGRRAIIIQANLVDIKFELKSIM